MALQTQHGLKRPSHTTMCWGHSCNTAQDPHGLPFCVMRWTEYAQDCSRRPWQCLDGEAGPLLICSGTSNFSGSPDPSPALASISITPCEEPSSAALPPRASGLSQVDESARASSAPESLLRGALGCTIDSLCCGTAPSMQMQALASWQDWQGLLASSLLLRRAHGNTWQCHCSCLIKN